MLDQPEPAQRENRWLVPGLCLILAIAVVWTFAPALKGAFLFSDDAPYVYNNSHINTGLTWSNLVFAFVSLGNSNWHPVTWISHMLDCQFYGVNPWGHHLTNIIF